MNADAARLVAECEPDRDVLLGDTGYRLELWYAGTMDHGRVRCAYRFHKNDGTVLFEGDTYSPSPTCCYDSDESLRGLISFLTLGVGDTDEEYFTDYTPDQLAWAEEYNRERENIADYSDREMGCDDTTWRAKDFPLIDA